MKPRLSTVTVTLRHPATGRACTVTIHGWGGEQQEAQVRAATARQAAAWGVPPRELTAIVQPAPQPRKGKHR